MAEAGESPVTIPSAGPTRWNSQARLLKAATVNERFLRMVPGLILPTDAQWAIGRGLRLLLEPFLRISNMLQAHTKPTGSLVIPFIRYLESYYVELDECTSTPSLVLVNAFS